MSLKLGIVTIHNSPNYGACLQAFALYFYLNNKGYDCEIIDFARPVHADYKKSKKYKVLINSQKQLSARRLVKRVKSFLTLKRVLKNNSSYLEKKLIKDRRFEKFNSQVKLSRRYSFIDDLYADPPQYDVYITGSDQVWNPGNGYPVEPYFLTFAKNGMKKIAYAPSFGVSSLPESVMVKYKEWLGSYAHLSIREDAGKKLLAELTSRSVDVVLDPTFLIDIHYWESIAKKADIAGKYIFCFILNKNELLLSYVKKIMAESGLKLVVISQNPVDACSDTFLHMSDAGPEEFLGLIQNAEIVFTDSFHATVFSLMFAKNFFSYIAAAYKRGNRVTNLLQLFSLSEHLLKDGLTQNSAELLQYKIDREQLNKKIHLEQKKSREFLINAIES